jgi:hypothetical protein
MFVDLMLGECVSSKTTGRCSRRCFPENSSKWRRISGAVERLRAHDAAKRVSNFCKLFETINCANLCFGSAQLGLRGLAGHCANLCY